MSKPKTTPDYCVRHGHQDFFLGFTHDQKGNYTGEAIHCPKCFPDHLDNPTNQPKREVFQEDLDHDLVARYEPIDEMVLVHHYDTKVVLRAKGKDILSRKFASEAEARTWVDGIRLGWKSCVEHRQK